jgi:hypothetical protein
LNDRFWQQRGHCQDSSADWLGSWPDRLQKTSLFSGSKVSHFWTWRFCRKTGPLCSTHLHKGLALSCLAAILNGYEGRFISFGRGFAFRPGRDPEAKSLSRVYDYFFFEVFFATFLVAAFVVFFAFFAFLAMSSSVKKLAQ